MWLFQENLRRNQPACYISNDFRQTKNNLGRLGIFDLFNNESDENKEGGLHIYVGHKHLGF